MFFVLNKSKIISYTISVLTVVILFVMAFTITKNESIQTATTNKLLPIYSVETQDKKIAFTMNCAWNADDIDSILDTLSKYKVHITFFMVGDFIHKYPEAVKKISDAGHEIGNHSDTHPHVNNLNLEKNKEQIQKCCEKIEKLTGNKSVFYRGPYGEYNNTVINAANSQNHITIQWNLDTLDYTGLTGEQMWERLKDKISPGSIILSHNGTKHTADSLDMILYNIEQAGYQVFPVSKVIYKDNYYIDANGVQKQNSENKNENIEGNNEKNNLQGNLVNI